MNLTYYHKNSLKVIDIQSIKFPLQLKIEITFRASGKNLSSYCDSINPDKDAAIRQII